jgi:hypothetical protein
MESAKNNRSISWDIGRLCPSSHPQSKRSALHQILDGLFLDDQPPDVAVFAVASRLPLARTSRGTELCLMRRELPLSISMAV